MKGLSNQDVRLQNYKQTQFDLEETPKWNQRALKWQTYKILSERKIRMTKKHKTTAKKCKINPATKRLLDCWSAQNESFGASDLPSSSRPFVIYHFLFLFFIEFVWSVCKYAFLMQRTQLTCRRLLHKTLTNANIMSSRNFNLIWKYLQGFCYVRILRGNQQQPFGYCYKPRKTKKRACFKSCSVSIFDKHNFRSPYLAIFKNNNKLVLLY